MKKFYGIFIMLLVAQLGFAQKVTVPQLTSPENGYEYTMPNAILNWDASAGVGTITYHIQLATDDSFTTFIIDETVDISAYYNEYLMFGQQYYWRVKSIDDNGSSDWSVVYDFTIFSVCENKDPGDEDDELEIRPTIKWKNLIDGEAIEGLDGFHIEIDTESTFDSPLSQIYTSGYDDEDELNFAIHPDYLLFGETYYWHMRPMHAEDEGTWSETWSFETIAEIELDDPSNNEEDVQFDQEVSWKDKLKNSNNKDENEDVFEFTCQISLEDTFADPITLVTHEFELIPDFYKFGTQYFWRVKATHPNDVSPWSEIQSFTTINEIILDEPTDGLELNTYRPVLKWEDIKEVDGYQIRLSKNAENSDAMYYSVLGAGQDNYPLNELEANMYYWSVRAFNDNDTCAWTENFSFSTLNVGINEINNVSNISIYPNPATTTLSVEFVVIENSELELNITDILGKSMISESVSTQVGEYKKTFDISKLESGVYFLEVKQGENNNVTKFVVK